MRAVLLIGSLGVLASACAEDPWPIRPAGGGAQGSIDTSPGPDGPDADTTPVGIAGRVCVIDDWDNAFTCADITIARDARVQANALETRSLADRTYSIPAATGDVQTLIVGDEVDEVDLLATYSSVTRGSDVDAMVIDEVLWEDTLTTLLEADSGGALVVYVRDATDLPIAGATVTKVAAPVGLRDYYDDGVGGWDGNAITTGPDGIALLLDAGTGSVAVSAPNFVNATAAAPTLAGAAGVVVVTLAADPP